MKFLSLQRRIMLSARLIAYSSALKMLALLGNRTVLHDFCQTTAEATPSLIVTICAAVNAVGNSLPPFLVFPRINFKQHMLKGAPQGSTDATSGSGWMKSETFVEFLHYFWHFIKQTRCSCEHPVLLCLDKHDIHISIASLISIASQNLAKENGIHLLTFPPHCSHKLPPLDRSVFGPLKRQYSAGCDAWLLKNPGKPLTIYDISEVLGYAFPRAFSPTNITKNADS